MALVDKILVAILLLWSAGSVVFLFRIPLIHQALVRINASQLFVHWGLFSPSDPSLRPGTFELRFRDWRPDGTVTPWRTGASGHCWSWRAAFWLPQRYLASALQNLGRRFRMWVMRTPPAVNSIAHDAPVLTGLLARRHPPVAGVRREIWLGRSFPSRLAEDETVWEHRPAPDDAAR